jgi:hypothetical protein
MFAEGIYKARARSWHFNKTTNGNTQFEMTFEVIGKCPHDDFEAPPEPCDPGVGSWSITKTPDNDNEHWLARVVVSLGYSGSDLLGLDPDNPGAHDFTGVEFFVACKHEEFRDESSEKWTVRVPALRTPADASALQALNAPFSDALRRAREDAAKSRRKNKPQGPHGPDVSDESVPF